MDVVDICWCRFKLWFLIGYYFQSLGYPRASLTLVNADYGYKPQLKYLEGNICPQDPHTKMSSQIDFHCDPAAGKVIVYSKEFNHQNQNLPFLKFNSRFYTTLLFLSEGNANSARNPGWLPLRIWLANKCHMSNSFRGIPWEFMRYL